MKAKSWGKVKDDSDVATVLGDVTIMFPLAMISALEEVEEGEFVMMSFWDFFRREK